MGFRPDPKPKPKTKLKAYEYRQMMMTDKKTRNKYNAIKQTYNGYNYDSRREARHAAELDFRIKAGEVTRWERQHKIELIIKGTTVARYYIDFKVYMADGSVEFHEVKGKETQLWRLKWKIAKVLYPEYNFKLIK